MTGAPASDAIDDEEPTGEALDRLRGTPLCTTNRCQFSGTGCGSGCVPGQSRQTR